MAGLVRRHAQGRETRAVKVVRRQSETLIRRIVVVAQHPFHFDDLHVVDTRALHHGRCRRPARDAVARWNLDILAIGAHHAHLRVKAEQQGHTDKNNIEDHGRRDLGC